MFLFTNGGSLHRSGTNGGLAICGVRSDPDRLVAYTPEASVPRVRIAGTECVECFATSPSAVPTEER